MPKAGNILEALAVGVGSAMEGYGKGTVQVLLQQRQQALEDERAFRSAAIRKEERIEERAWQKEDTAEERAYKEKLIAEERAYQESQDEKRFGRSLALKKAGGSGGGRGSGSKQTAAVREVEELVSRGIYPDFATAWKAEKGRVSRSGGGREPAAIEEAEALVERGVYGTFEEAYKAVRGGRKGEDTGSEVSAKEYADDIATEAKALASNPRNMNKSPQELNAMAKAAVESRYADVGISVKGRKAADVNPPVEVQTKEAIPSVASTEVGKPSGSGTDSDPYRADTQEQLDWVMKNTKGGTVVRIFDENGNPKLIRKPK